MTRYELSSNTVFMLFAIGITLVLFFIDEGYYSFHWMSQIGNWIPFIGYVIVLFLGQWITNVILKTLTVTKVPQKWSVLIGPIISLAVIFGMYYLIR